MWESIDWKWVAGVAIPAVVVGLHRLNARVTQLEKQLAQVVQENKAIRSEPFPSDTTEEMIAIRQAKELCKKLGSAFTFEQAYRAVKTVRDAKKAKGAGAGGNESNDNKRTA